MTQQLHPAMRIRILQVIARQELLTCLLIAFIIRFIQGAFACLSAQRLLACGFIPVFSSLRAAPEGILRGANGIVN